MEQKILKILLPAVGGQGGGVLTEWIFQAFLKEGYEVQGISLPGLSQRGGSTVYYLEASAASANSHEIIFSQHPVPGDVDVIISQEFLELGRMLEQGYGSDKTTIVSSTHRIYSTLEKLPLGSGIYSEENLYSIAREFSSEFIGIDALNLAKNHDMSERAVNAILLGALCSSDSLPLEKVSYLSAIEDVGISVEDNIKAFNIGFGYVNARRTANDNKHKETGIEILCNKYGIPDKKIKKVSEFITPLQQRIPLRLHEILNEAVVRLCDYQGLWYAQIFLDHINRIVDQESNGTDNSYRLTETVIKNLALLMSYEDGIRVAELKIRKDRFERIKKDMVIGDKQLFHVVDYLKPDSEEIYGLLPNAVVNPALRLLATSPMAKLRRGKPSLTFTQTPVTSSFSGFFRMWLIARFKPLRPYSYRYRKEHEVIDKYLSSVHFYADVDYELGCMVAKGGSIIKGYGRVRRRTIDTFMRFLDIVVSRLFSSSSAGKHGYSFVVSKGYEALEFISQSEDGIKKAEDLVLNHLEGNGE